MCNIVQLLNRTIVILSQCELRTVILRCDYVLHTHYQGLMLFWDLRACKFLESTMNSNRAVTLKVYRISLLGEGWAQTRSSIENVFIPIFSAGFKRMGAKG